MSTESAVEVVALGLPDSGAVSSGAAGAQVTVYGHPYISDRPVRGALDVGGLLADPATFVKSLDGEFVVVIESAEKLVLISDRYVSRPVFYSKNTEKFAFSFSYSNMWDWLRSSNLLRPSKYAFYEFLKFQRLFGDKTLDESSRMLAPASVLTLSKGSGEVAIDRYWAPDFEKRSSSIKEVASDLAAAVKQSIKVKSIGFDNVSLLLSGGMDSRVVLGGFDRNSMPNAITIGSSQNNEVSVARELAELSNASHHFTERSATHYEDIFERATAVGGSMYSYQHGHFFGLDMPIESSLLLHGHGFDYMFQGMYLPSRRRSFLGRSTRSYELIRPSQIADEYFDSAKYQLKGIDPSSLLRDAEASGAEESVRSSIRSIAGEVEGRAVEPYDVWDYLTFGWPGRHYTYLNLLSADTMAHQQTVAWDNSIYDLFHSTPATIRFGTGLLAETIRELRPELLNVRNANTNMSPELSGRALTLAGWRRGLLRRLGLGGGSSLDPDPGNRSWPSIGGQIRSSNLLSDRVRALGDSEFLDDLALFDMSKIGVLAREFESGSAGSGAGLATLLTIDQFLRRD
jgi:hypothetical protein